jgi:crossover junction endodeoxyribonuclease RusA
MFEPISFFVSGVAKPAGSKRGFFIPKINRVVIVDANPNSKDWKTDVKHAASEHYKGPLIETPIILKLTFFIVRPKGHFRTGKNSNILRDSAPAFPTSKPDVLKLARGVEDALTGIIYKDDSLIVTEHLYKRYCEQPGVQIEISEQTL